MNFSLTEAIMNTSSKAQPQEYLLIKFLWSIKRYLSTEIPNWKHFTIKAPLWTWSDNPFGPASQWPQATWARPIQAGISGQQSQGTKSEGKTALKRVYSPCWSFPPKCSRAATPILCAAGGTVGPLKWLSTSRQPLLASGCLRGCNICTLPRAPYWSTPFQATTRAIGLSEFQFSKNLSSC